MSHFAVGAALLSRRRRNRAKILFGPGVTDSARKLSRGDVESGDQRLSAMALVFELAAFDLAPHHRQARRNTLKRCS